MAKQKTVSAFKHFGTQAPEKSYKDLEGLRNANIWIEKTSIDIKRVVAEYDKLKSLQSSEEDFKALAIEVFFLREWGPVEAPPDRQWRAERVLGLQCPPSEHGPWRLPPEVYTHVHPECRSQLDTWRVYDRPDCAYWLSLKGFSLEDCFKVEQYGFKHGHIVYPYLTIEFQRDGETDADLGKRIKATGSVALYNRWYLYKEARSRVEPERAGNKLDIRHYGLTCTGHQTCIWILRPKLDSYNKLKWEGFTMAKVVEMDCMDEDAIANLMEWINEIHRWGLSEHGPSVERNIEAIRTNGALGTSGFS
ncbi:hypothetical protein F5Y10DRAFT_100450 [Nemania abortiva]|nr:hypothetical protein F5Y10DRAFT_100450 [Nemania abortiva]